MKECGILFKTEMVKAILNTKPDVWPAEPIDPTKPYKWQTRRLVKISHLPIADVCNEKPEFIGFDRNGSAQFRDSLSMLHPVKLPYGGVGSRLWVRETWYPFGDAGAVWYKAGIPQYRTAQQVGWLNFPYKLDSTYDPPKDLKWRSPIYMPRWASRINLEVKAVRVEKLQEITERDVIAEGAAIYWPGPGPEPYPRNLPACYGILWDSINPKTLWKTNPYVWVYEFVRVTQ